MGEQDSAVILLYDPADVPRPYPVFFAPVPFAGQKISVLFFHLMVVSSIFRKIVCRAWHE